MSTNNVDVDRRAPFAPAALRPAQQNRTRYDRSSFSSFAAVGTQAGGATNCGSESIRSSWCRRASGSDRSMGRLGGDDALVLGEAIEPRHDEASREVWTDVTFVPSNHVSSGEPPR